METRIHSAKFLQQRKFYTVLPVLALPFLTFLYWILIAKGKGNESGAVEISPKGLNMSLPDAFFKEKPMDKLSYYQKAAEDSAKRAEQIRKDPYRSGEQILGTASEEHWGLEGLSKRNDGKSIAGQSDQPKRISTSKSEARVYSKLRELDRVLAESAEPDFSKTPLSEVSEKAPSKTSAIEMSPEIAKLESLMAGLEKQPAQADLDPEMKEISSMLDKIMDIQHPERIADKIRKESEVNKSRVLPVSASKVESPITLLTAYEKVDTASNMGHEELPLQTNGFFSLEGGFLPVDENAAQAVVHQQQTVVAGATIKLRLTSDIYVAGRLVPRESFVFGTASLSDERLMISINSIKLENSLFPVKLSVYDLDGLEGIYVPGAISRDVAKQSLSQDIQGLDLGLINPSLGAQAVNAGIQTAQTFLGRKTRLVQVTLKAGYQVLLKDKNSRPI